MAGIIINRMHICEMATCFRLYVYAAVNTSMDNKLFGKYFIEQRRNSWNEANSIFYASTNANLWSLNAGNQLQANEI